MIAGSLRWRLLLAAAAAILLALAVAWVFMTLLFEWHLLRRLESEMTRDGARLAAALSIGADGAPRVAQAPADSRLDTPAGGYYWQASSPGGVVRSRSLWDAELARVEDAPLDQWRRRQASGPFGQSLVVVERRIRPDAGGAAVLVQLAQDDAPVRAARAEFGRELAAFLLLLWLVLLGAAWLQVRLGLAPLARVGRDLAALRDNAVARLP
ncbi:MAG: sensor histidine kinase, partial [Xanthomonadales bacterium]|nr:sensor histidine kinase [Xanthomonadales bacterium]